jgi:hypothetical protein
MSRAPCSPISVMRSRRERPSRGPGLEQPHLGHLRDLLGLQHQRQLGDGDAAAVAGETARLLDGSGIAAGGRDEGELGGGGKVGLLGAGEGGERRTRAALDKGVGGQLGDGELRAAVGEDDASLALARVEEEGKLQRLQGLTRGEHAVDEKAGERADQRGGVMLGKAVVGEEGGDGGVERRIGKAAGDPVAEAPVVAVAPHLGVGGEGRIGARVPAVDVDVGEVEHRRGVDGRGRVGAGDVVGVGRIEGLVERLQVAALHDVVAGALRVVGQERLRALRVDEDVGLIGAFVDGGGSRAR